GGQQLHRLRRIQRAVPGGKKQLERDDAAVGYEFDPELPNPAQVGSVEDESAVSAAVALRGGRAGRAPRIARAGPGREAGKEIPGRAGQIEDPVSIRMKRLGGEAGNDAGGGSFVPE